MLLIVGNKSENAGGFCCREELSCIAGIVKQVIKYTMYIDNLYIMFISYESKWLKCCIHC